MSSYLLPAAECPRNNNSCERGFAHVDSPRGLKCIFILHENIYTTRVATLSAEELGTVSNSCVFKFLRRSARATWVRNATMFFVMSRALSRSLWFAKSEDNTRGQSTLPSLIWDFVLELGHVANIEVLFTFASIVSITKKSKTSNECIVDWSTEALFKPLESILFLWKSEAIPWVILIV